MPPPSLAREFFDRITTVASIQGLYDPDPARTTQETDWLDFKTEHPDPKQREKKVKETWSEALGGFANNQGGVLVWGMDARPTKFGSVEIDAVCGEKPVTDPLALKSRLVELQRQATDPPMTNVEIRAFELPSDPSKGFVVCYVPEGPFKPYRSEQAGQQWFLRAGDNTVVMSPAVLRALFYPRSRAVFQAKANLTWELPHDRRYVQGTVARVWLSLTLVNKGQATAKDTSVSVQLDLGKGSQKEDLRFGPGSWPRRVVDTKDVFMAGRPLHPGDSDLVFAVNWDVPARGSPKYDARVVPVCSLPTLSVTVYCENQEPQTISVEFDEEEFFSEGQRCDREGGPA